jgi:hypothetical protein
MSVDTDTTETINLVEVLAIGGNTYNHGGQLLMTTGGIANRYFLGDDYGKFTALDVLVREILDYPNNFGIRDGGEIVSIKDDSYSLQITTQGDNGMTQEYYEPYTWLDVEVLVNTHK